MSILVNAKITAVTQGMTGNTGTSHTGQAQANFTESVDAVMESFEARKGIDSALA